MIKKGLSPRFAEIGKIKIGGKGEKTKSKNGKEFYKTVKFNHFVITTTEKGPDGNFLPNQEIMSRLGNEPKEISIRLPFDDIDMNFYTAFQFYKGRKCLCHGDGEHATRISADGKESKIKCDTNLCQYLLNHINEVDTTDKCKPSGILSCHLTASLEIGGIYRFRTHSWNTVSGILSALKYFSENTNGVLQGLPLKLKFIKKATAEHGNVSIVTIVLDGVEMLKMREMALIEYENRMKLGIDMKQIENQAKKAGYEIDTDDPEDVEAEFYTPTVEYVEIIEKPGVTSDEAAEKLKDKTDENTTTEGNLL